MEKLKIRYVCQSCGQTSLKWLGKCPGCDQWDTFIEEVVSTANRISLGRQQPTAKVSNLSDISAGDFQYLPVGISEFDRLLGGGIVPGAVILLGGEPGIGKSTLLLQVACSLAGSELDVLYVSGEESAQQTKLRAQRLGLAQTGLNLLTETNLSNIITQLESLKPKVAIIDSIQIIYLPELSSAPGSVAQLREGVSALVRIAKTEGISLLLIGHVTKSGAIAGPRVVEHLVDTVLYFEGDSHHQYRILRAVKNRFGSTDEIGIFTMRENGLQEVNNPSQVFIDTRKEAISGTTVVAAIEGTRPLLVELQALVSSTIFGMPERRTTGLDHRRLAILLAVLEKRVGLRLQDKDVFVNIAGGIKLWEPAIDLGIVMTVVSSFREIPIPGNVVVFGEVGLGGEVRPVSQAERRIAEARRLGFKTVILPQANNEQIKDKKDIELVGVDTVNQAVEFLLAYPKTL